jgi:hypothetical protein
MSFFNLEVLKKKPIKSMRIMAHLKISKNIFLGQKIEKKFKIATHMDLQKYDQISPFKSP